MTRVRLDYTLLTQISRLPDHSPFQKKRSKILSEPEVHQVQREILSPAASQEGEKIRFPDFEKEKNYDDYSKFRALGRERSNCFTT